jgi:RNA polymerase sigma factor (sigma-70 family)
MPSDRLTVFIIDDDASVRDALSLRLGIEGYRTALFADAEAFLAALPADAAGCVVADLKLPGQSGLALQAELARRGAPLPVAIITAHGDLDSARAAFQAKAIDFLSKPFEMGELLTAVSQAFAREEQRMQGEEARRQESMKLARLTGREREVLERVAEGLHAKEIAAQLGISPRTVEVHKARIMEKLDARNVAELVRFVVGGSR